MAEPVKLADPPNSALKIAAAGADTFVAGSAIFGSDDYAATIAGMKAEIAAAVN